MASASGHSSSQGQVPGLNTASFVFLRPLSIMRGRAGKLPIGKV